VEDAADGRPNAIGDDKFLEHTHHEQGPGIVEIFGLPAARRFDLGQEFLRPIHWPGGDLWKKGDEQRERNQVTRGADYVFRYIQ
jgi:hypothetical protein